MREATVRELLAAAEARRQPPAPSEPDLFGQAWPEAPAAADEQAGLSLPGATLQGQYDAWRQTAEGRLAFAAFVRRAQIAKRSGDRVSAKALWEVVRADLRVKMNNNYHALAAREAEQVAPELAGAFEKRRRTAA